MSENSKKDQSQNLSILSLLLNNAKKKGKSAGAETN